MTRPIAPSACVALACLAGFALCACGGEEEIGRMERPTAPPEAAKPAGPSAAPGAPGAATGDGTAGTGATAPPEVTVYRDEDFVESERNRDPFRSYLKAFRAQPPEEIQRRVVMPTTAVEEMKLIAIVGGIPRPKAMLLDQMSVGHVVERGVYVGRAKMIQAAGSVAMVLNWRVDRIRENEVVLTRQDPADPTRPALTRVIPLDEELSKAQ